MQIGSTDALIAARRYWQVASDFGEFDPHQLDIRHELSDAELAVDQLPHHIEGLTRQVRAFRRVDRPLAHAWLHQQFDQWHEELDEYTREKIEWYGSDSYIAYNDMLRGKLPKEQWELDAAREDMQLVLDAMDKCRLAEPIVVYRALAFDGDGQMQGPAKGSKSQEKAFVSTSLTPEGAADFIGTQRVADGRARAMILRLVLPKGMPICPLAMVQSAADLRQEDEILLPPGCELICLESQPQVHNGVAQVTCFVRPPAHLAVDLPAELPVPELSQMGVMPEPISIAAQTEAHAINPPEL